MHLGKKESKPNYYIRQHNETFKSKAYYLVIFKQASKKAFCLFIIVIKKNLNKLEKLKKKF